MKIVRGVHKTIPLHEPEVVAARARKSWVWSGDDVGEALATNTNERLK